uniref:Retrovirus-related Pol polyprotein from transposon TNT 1-94 n=1 Tax=Tanacetum cinerariifolium TaxID=118510 RepID=A0A699H8W1_TANCI|nr:retrovirus-related Pol polyprotein from transposon TNT 1-94 [Tanacetum cinerariifolium]
MTGNMSYLSEYEEINGGYVSFRGDPKKGKITIKGIKREFSVAMTPQQNGVAERKNRTLIKAARTTLADSKLPTTFWAEAINTACYVQNRVLVIKPHNKIPYELFHGRTLSLSFMRPFGCHVTILNTLDHLGKFDRKADEGYFVGYSVNRKALRVFNCRMRIIEETMHFTFLENKPNVASAGKARVETVPDKDYILLPLWTQDPLFSSSSKDSPGDGFKPSGEEEKKDAKDPGNKDNEVLSTEETKVNQEKDVNVNSTNNINTISQTANAASIKDNAVDKDIVYGCTDDLNIHNLEEINFSDDDENVGVEADMTNLDFNIPAFLDYASFKDFVVYQMDVKSAFLYGRIEKEVYVCQPLTFEDLEFPDSVYKVEKALYGLHQAPRSWYETLSTYLLDNGFHRASTPMETSKPLLKDENAEDVDVQLYRSMIGLLMYLTSLRPDIMFTDSPFDLEAYTDSDFAGASLERKTTIGGCQFLRNRLISRQCKKQTVVANSTTEAKYVAASNCRGHATAKVNTINGVEQIQALVDKKKVIITDLSVRSDLQLEDDEGTECLPNAIIFEQLTFMGFVQVLLDKQVKEMFKYKEIYVTPSHSKKVFANIKRHGKEFSGRFPPLFLTMLVQAQQEVDERTAIPTDTQQTPTIIQPTTSQLQRKQKTKKPKRKDADLPQTSVPTEVVADEVVYEEMYDSVGRAATTATGLDAEQDMGIISSSRRIESLDEASLGDRENASKHRRVIDNFDPDEGVTLVSTADPVITAGEVVTTAEPEETAIRTTTIVPSQGSKDKGKAKMIEPKKHLKNKNQIMIDEEVARNLEAQLQAELEEEEGLARL